MAEEKIQDGMRQGTGKQQQFNTGAVRDVAEGKAMLSLISPIAEERLGQWLTLGAKRYSSRNWEKGIPMSRTMDSLKRHINHYMMGDRSEDNLAAIMCNAMFLIHFEEMIAAGKLPKDLDDLPRYETEIKRKYLVHPVAKANEQNPQ